MLHELKTWPAEFAEVLSGRKTHEIRKTDRPFAVGDTLLLREWDPTRGTWGGHTGKALAVVVTALTPGGTWGLPSNVCAMSIRVAKAQLATTA